MNKKAVIVFAEGFEEIEAVTPTDILRRADVQVELVGLNAAAVTGAHGIVFKMDRVLNDAENVDAIILPGGMPGAQHLSESERLARLLKAHLEDGKIVGAICAAPGVVLGRHGLLAGRKATCYPGFEKEFGKGTHVDEAVVVDGNLITSKGPGTAFAFGLALACALAGDAKADELAEAMQYG
jgi:4-methyl-5(b-hydroxyethyl)-thiazole monophosphate biosynthesis